MMRSLKDVQILKRGIFELPFMNSRISTGAMTRKEKILGFFVGPLGMAFFACSRDFLMELYYTQVFVIDKIYGIGTYGTMIVVTRAVGFALGLLLSWFVSKTVSSQGRIRPYLLTGGLITIVSGFCLFWIPDIGRTGQLIWVYVFNMVSGWAVAAYALRSNLVALSSRSQKDRTQLTTINGAATYMVAGIFGGVIVASLLYYSVLYGKPASNWITLLGISALVAVPMLFIEYFYTKERVMMEDKAEHQDTQGAVALSVGQQIKLLLTDRNWMLLTTINLIALMGSTLSGTNIVANYCQFVLGATVGNQYQTLYTILSGLPMGIGMLFIYPITRKFGIRNVTLVSFGLSFAGNLLCLLNPSNFTWVILCKILVNVGTIATAYVFGALLISSLDSLELRGGYRLEGSPGVFILTSLTGTILSLPFGGLYETILVSSKGFQQVKNATGAYEIIIGEEGKNWIMFVFFLVPAIISLLSLFCLYFVNLEKILPDIQSRLLTRKKLACEARGELWIAPEEAERLEQEKGERIVEENRIKDLKQRCTKKGFNFDTENNKVLNKRAKKEVQKAR